MLQNHKVLIHLLAIVIVSIWGTTYVVTKILLGAGLNAADIFFYRFILAYLLTWPLCFRKLWCENWRDEALMVLAGFTGGSLYFLAENTALTVTPACDIAILVSACPIWTSIILALAYKSERLSRRQTLGVVLAFIGVALVIFNGQVVLHISPLGYALGLLSGLTWAFYQWITKPIVGKYSAWFISRKVFFYGLVTILPYYLYQPLNTDAAILTKPEVIVSIVGLSLVANVGCYALWNLVMKGLGAVKSSFYIYLSPVATMFMAYFALGERITLMAVLGLVILVIGMVMAEKAWQVKS